MPVDPIQIGDFRIIKRLGALALTLTLDWMVNDGGILHGGFSIRYQRSRLPESERSAYDAHIGVTEYA